jgi:hypothetical protein
MTLEKQEICELGIAKEQAAILSLHLEGMQPEIAACPRPIESANFRGANPEVAFSSDSP